MLVCTHCNAENPSWAPNCQACQAPLQPSMACPTCGALVLKRVNFCGQCGTDLRQGSLERWNTASSTAVTPPSVTPPSVTPPVPPTLQQSIADREEPSAAVAPLAPQLLHLRTQTPFKLPLGDATLYIGKTNDRHPPDIDLSNIPDSDVVSRVHARLMVQSGEYYLEDLDSSNGTYVNDTALIPHQPHLLTKADRISLGRNNLVSFSFRLQ